MPEQTNTLPSETPEIESKPAELKPQNSSRRKLFLALAVGLVFILIAIAVAWRVSANQTSDTSTSTAENPETEVEEPPIVPEPEKPRRLIYVVSPSGQINRGEEYYELHLTDTEKSFDETIYSTKGFLRDLDWKDSNTLIIHDSSYGDNDLNSTYYLKQFDIPTKDYMLLDNSKDSRGLDIPFLKTLAEPIYISYEYDLDQKTTSYTLNLLVDSEYLPVYTWTMKVGIAHPPHDISFGNWDRSADTKHYLGYFNPPLLDESQPDLVIFDAQGKTIDSLYHPSISNAKFVSDTEIIFKENVDILNSVDGKLFKYNFVTKSKQEIGPYTYSRTAVDLSSRSILAMQHYAYNDLRAPDVIIIDLDTFEIKQTIPGAALHNEGSNGQYTISGAVYDTSTYGSLYKVTSKQIFKNGIIENFLDIPEGKHISVYFEPNWDK